MTAKQIKFFGTKRQRAALKAKRHNAAAKAHRKRSKPMAHRKRSKPVAHRKRKQNRAKPRHASHKKRTNPGAIYALVNPAKGRKMAAKRHKKRASKRHNPFAGKRHMKKTHHRRRSNPGMLPRPADWFALGGGAVVGGVGATQLPILFLGSSNNGVFGYVATIAATGILAIAGHYLFKRNTMLTAGIVAGGGGALIRRIMQDFSVPGSTLVNAGVGDIITDWNFSTPQIAGPGAIPRGLNNPYPAPALVPVNVAGAGMSTGRSLY